MIVFLYFIIILGAGLLISLIMPGGMADINLGFYLIILSILFICGMSIIFRQKSDFIKLVSDYVVIILSIFIIAEIAMICFSSSQSTNDQQEAIIVPGGGLFIESRLTDELESRLDKALEISASNPHLPIVLSGGRNDRLTLPQCVAMKTYLENKSAETGISLPTLITEDSSTELYENIRTSLNLSGTQSAYVIVSRHNVPRTKIILSRISPSSTVVASDYPASKYLIYYIRELGFALKTLVADGIIK